MSEPFYPSSTFAWQALKTLSEQAPSVQTAMNDIEWQRKAQLQLHELTLNVSHHRMSADIFDALLALLEGKAEELLFDGRELSGRAIEESLPLLGSPLCPDGSADHGNFLAPLRHKWGGHTEDFTSPVEGEITLPPVHFLSNEKTFRTS